MRGDTGDVLGNPGLEGGVGLVGVVLLNKPLDRQGCIDHHGPVHAQLSILASPSFSAQRTAHAFSAPGLSPFSIQYPTRGLVKK